MDAPHAADTPDTRSPLTSPSGRWLRSRSGPRLFTLGATVLLPLWVALGRTLFGVGGWMLFLTLYVVPVLFAWLLVLTVLTLLRPSVRRGEGLNRGEAVGWAVVIAAALALELTLVDGGDTDESQQSVLTRLAGNGAKGISQKLFPWCEHVFLYGLAGLTLIACWALARELVGTARARGAGRVSRAR